MLSFPQVQWIKVYPPRDDDDDDEDGDGNTDLGEPGQWINLVSHLLESCPNLRQLDVMLEPFRPRATLNFERLAALFPSHVFPHLPQESPAEVNVVFWACMHAGCLEVSLSGYLVSWWELSWGWFRT